MKKHRVMRTQSKILIFSLLTSLSEAVFSQGVPSGPSAARKPESNPMSNSGGIMNQPPAGGSGGIPVIRSPEMRGNLTEGIYVFSLPGRPGTGDLCKVENKQIANLTALNRLLEEKIKELIDSKTAKK